MEQNAVRVHDETMGCFVAQMMDSCGADRRADLFEAIWGKLASVLGSDGVQRHAKFGGLTNLWVMQSDDKGITSKWVLIWPSKLSMEWQT